MGTVSSTSSFGGLARTFIRAGFFLSGDLIDSQAQKQGSFIKSATWVSCSY